jgi:regulatory protein
LSKAESGIFAIALWTSLRETSFMFNRRNWKRPKVDEDEDSELKEIVNIDRARQKTFDRAVNLLTYKPRSVRELRERLLEKSWTNLEIIDSVIEKLKEYNYLNDEQFAKDFAASKIRQKPIGKRVLQQKLATKKLDRETVDKILETAFEETTEADLIERAAAKRLRLKGKPETREDSKKFFDYLMRQGFGYELVRDEMQKIKAMEFEEEE